MVIPMFRGKYRGVWYNQLNTTPHHHHHHHHKKNSPERCFYFAVWPYNYSERGKKKKGWCILLSKNRSKVLPPPHTCFQFIFFPICFCFCSTAGTRAIIFDQMRCFFDEYDDDDDGSNWNFYCYCCVCECVCVSLMNFFFVHSFIHKFVSRLN